MILAIGRINNQEHAQEQDGSVSARSTSRRDKTALEARTRNDWQVTVKALEVAGGDIVYKLACCADEIMNLGVYPVPRRVVRREVTDDI